MSVRVQRWYATDGTRDFLYEAYVLDKEHRARLSVICGHEHDWAVGSGSTETAALWAAIDAYKTKFPHLYKDDINAPDT